MESGLNYRVGGSGPVVVLLHGYTQTSHMWIPLMPLLATSHTVIAPDLRGIGGSERTPGGYDKKTMAKDVRELVHQLGHDQPAVLVGHDIGLMVAYAYAACAVPRRGEQGRFDGRLAAGVGDWKSVAERDLCALPLPWRNAPPLVKGRERALLRQELEGVKINYQRDIESYNRQIDRIYDRNKWFIGLMFSMALDYRARHKNFIQARKKPD